MPSHEARLWNTRYTKEPECWLSRSPHKLLHDHIELLNPDGLVLEVAAGAAITGLYLAELGFRVIALDISLAGLLLARRRADRHDVPLSMAAMDLSDPWLPPAHFDTILNFYYLSRPLLGCYQQALKPGGLLFFETFVRQIDQESNSEHYLERGELLNTLREWEIIYWAEIKRHRGASSQSSRLVSQLVTRKPSRK
jgi:tellurite methyltransferase